jgi:hypothetical protein
VGTWESSDLRRPIPDNADAPATCYHAVQAGAPDAEGIEFAHERVNVFGHCNKTGHYEAVALPHTLRHVFQAAIFLAASNKFHHQLVFNCPLLNCAVQLRTRDDDG